MTDEKMREAEWEVEIERLASDVVRDVAELPDRNSPEDQPLMLLVTSEELFDLICNRFKASKQEGEEVSRSQEEVPDELIARLAEALRCHAGSPHHDDAAAAIAEALRPYLTPPSVRSQALEAAIKEIQQELLDKDDRTSPEEYPDMVLITLDELADYLRYVAALSPCPGCRMESHGKRAEGWEPHSVGDDSGG